MKLQSFIPYWISTALGLFGLALFANLSEASSPPQLRLKNSVSECVGVVANPVILRNGQYVMTARFRFKKALSACACPSAEIGYSVENQNTQQLIWRGHLVVRPDLVKTLALGRAVAGGQRLALTLRVGCAGA